MDIGELLQIAIKRGASDIHLVVPNSPVLRIDGRLVVLDELPPLTPEISAEIFEAITSEAQRETFENEQELDFPLDIPDLSRFRVNASYQRGSISLVFRPILRDIPSFKELGLPEICKKLVMLPRGLILVTGPTGCGKSSTLAAMLNYLNENAEKKIVTIEDPIEYVYPTGKCIISQRHLGSDTRSFSNAVIHVLRQDPNVIMVGEMRDLETMASALTAAETGHLVLSTLHTRGAAPSISRIIDVFPAEQQTLIRTQLADVLEAVISQVLLKRADGKGRVAAFEIMLGTPAIKNLIRENKINQITSFIEVGIKEGMRTLDQDLERLLMRELITPKQVQAMTQGIDQIEIKEKKITTPSQIRRENADTEVRKITEQMTSSRHFQELIKLTVIPPVSSKQIKKLEEYLNGIQDLRIKFIGNSPKGGVEIIVSARKFPPLLNVLRQLPVVKKAVNNFGEILMRLS
jgi:twitching motility protein PilT